jgi:hypothetical protein
MPASSSAAFPHQPDHGAEPLVSFTFPVSWTFLSEYPQPAKEERKTPARTALVVATPAAPAPRIPRPEPRERVDQWEMVVPKMNRPAAKPVAEPKAAQLNAPEHKPVELHFTFPQSRSIPLPAIVAVIAMFMLLVAGVIAFLGKSAVAVPSKSVAPTVRAGAALPVGMDGWITVDWPRHVSLLKASSKLTDFRMEFDARIEAKALGWVFRAQDANNFYAMKLEIVKPGRDPIIALKRYTVIDGQDQPITQIPLPSAFRLDTRYKIRLEALGNQFTAWVMDQKVDQWTDPRYRSGSVGLFNDRGERASLEGDIRVFPLVKVVAK